MPRHLITTRDFDNAHIEQILADAALYLDEQHRDDLAGHIVINIFFENSTRTRSSFEVATKRLGGEVVNLDISTSSTSKGETLFDTAANLDAMGPSAIVVRHKNSGVPELLSRHVRASLINGGDGAHAHPTQAILDLFTLRKALGNLKGKKIAIVGDIKNSRVANSNIELLPRFGMEVSLVAPPHFMPAYELPKFTRLEEAIESGVDAIMSLRTQTERHTQPTYASLRDYGRDYCITKKVMGDRPIVLLHPGPVHRNIDIDDEMLADPRSLVLDQVRNGVAVRMAILKSLILGG